LIHDTPNVFAHDDFTIGCGKVIESRAEKPGGRADSIERSKRFHRINRRQKIRQQLPLAPSSRVRKIWPLEVPQ
jgi:hypothetical protein